MFRDIAMKDAATVMHNDEEAIQNAQGELLYSEEVDRSDHFTVIAQKRSPSPTGAA
jgi:hypothetical protein